MILISLAVSAVVTGATLTYAALLPQITGESPKVWIVLGMVVFAFWFAFSILVQRIRRIKHVGVARLFQVLAASSGIYGMATSNAKDLPMVAIYFAAYGSCALIICGLIWWVVEGFLAHRNK